METLPALESKPQTCLVLSVLAIFHVLGQSSQAAEKSSATGKRPVQIWNSPGRAVKLSAKIKDLVPQLAMLTVTCYFVKVASNLVIFLLWNSPTLHKFFVKETAKEKSP